MPFKFLLFLFQKIFFAVSTIISSFVSSVINFFFQSKNGKYSRKWLRLWGKTGVWLHFSRIKFINKPKYIDKTCVIICNHQSEIDIFVAAGYFPIDFVFFSKKEVFDNPFVGYGMRAAKYIAVDRSKPKEAAKALLSSKKLLQENISVLFYPEGTYSENADEFLEFKAGAFSIAAKTQKPIFPIVVYGTQNIYNDAHPYVRTPGKITIKFLDIIDLDHKLHPIQAKTKTELETLAKHYREMMQQAYDDILK